MPLPINLSPWGIIYIRGRCIYLHPISQDFSVPGAIHYLPAVMLIPNTLSPFICAKLLQVPALEVSNCSVKNKNLGTRRRTKLVLSMEKRKKVTVIQKGNLIVKS